MYSIFVYLQWKSLRKVLAGMDFFFPPKFGKHLIHSAVAATLQVSSSLTTEES